MINVDIDETYVIESELDPDCKGTFKPVTPRERGKYSSMAVMGDPMSITVVAFQDHIVNFEGLHNTKGNKIPFKKDEHLAVIPFEIQDELGRKLLEKNKLTKEEIKN